MIKNTNSIIVKCVCKYQHNSYNNQCVKKKQPCNKQEVVLLLRNIGITSGNGFQSLPTGRECKGKENDENNS